MNRIAECCCGQNTLEVSGEPAMHAVCNCDNCKKRTGSAFGISAYFKEEQLVGALPTDVSCYSFHHAEQDHDQQRYFCRSCGTTLFWRVSSLTGMIGIAGGCFITTPLSAPPVSVSHGQKCAWLSFDESCRAVE